MGCGLVTPVTVLMAVWNSPPGELEQAIDSVLSQTFEQFEFLIVNDGSTSPLVAPYLERRAAQDRRIRVVTEPHRGLTASLNRGLELAAGEWIARHDADDWSEPQRLAKQLRFFREDPAMVLCGTDAWMHQANGRRLWRTRLPRASEEILAALPRGNPFVHGSTMFSRRAALQAGGYSSELHCSQDYDLFWRLAENGRAANLGEPLYHYRYSGESVSAARAADQAVAHRAARILAERRRAGEPCDAGVALAEARREPRREESARRAGLKQADHLMLAGEYRRAARSYLSLVLRRPASALGWAKLFRLGVFVTLPPMREACFR
jgi:glycosyltransferase involved in cell wall biosynthesis